MLAIPATLAHLDEIARIEQDSYSTPWSREILRKELTGENIVGFVVLHPTVVGYAFMRLSFEEGHIESIAVAPDARQQGVASYLMQTLIAYATENIVTSLALEVRQGNRPAMALYHKFGFIVEGYRRGYYTNPSEDAILMRKFFVEVKA